MALVCTTNLSLFQMMHRTEDVEWIQYNYEQLQAFIPLAPPQYEKIQDDRLKQGYSERYMVQSKTHPLINELYDLWYPNGKKIIPFTWLEHHFTAESLAWWYQDDGHLKKNKNGVVEKLVLSTECWTDEEREWLQSILNLHFHLLFSIDGQKRLLLYDQAQIHYFLQLVEPWLQPCMWRKMKTASSYVIPSKRTTLKITSHFKCNKPTQQVNTCLSQFMPKLSFTPTVFQQTQAVQLEKSEKKAYQIQLTEENRQQFRRLHGQTGLSFNAITQQCFMEKSASTRPRLEDWTELSTAQQALLIGSILADGSLTRPNRVTSSYRENSCEEQRSYRNWKVQQLSPYLYFPGQKANICTRSSPVFKTLERLYYTEDRVKQIPFEQLQLYATHPHFLFALYMDDGSLLISHRINHSKKIIYITPHIALYLQNFHPDELEQLAQFMNEQFQVQFKIAKCPDGNGTILKTTTVKDTHRFLEAIESSANTYPSGFHKTNWNYRLQREKEKWHSHYPNYQLLTSDRKRFAPYSVEDVQRMQTMKKEGASLQQIADTLGRSYHSVHYKWRTFKN